LARDRYGKKPLLYALTGDYVAFSSEMKALLEWNIPKELDFTVLHQYLQLNYIPQPQSIFKGVAKVKPAHYMIFDNNGLQEYQPYYKIKIDSASYKRYTYNEAKDELVKRMDASV